MSTETLASRFQRSKGQPIEYRGDEVFPLYQRLIPMGKWRIIISRIAAKDNPTQGLRLKTNTGRFQVNEQYLPDIVLWADTSPNELELYLHVDKEAILKIWNVWSASGILQAWIGNAGMLIQSDENGVELKCSDGVGDVSFGDLVASIRIDLQAEK